MVASGHFGRQSGGNHHRSRRGTRTCLSFYFIAPKTKERKHSTNSFTITTCLVGFKKESSDKVLNKNLNLIFFFSGDQKNPKFEV